MTYKKHNRGFTAFFAVLVSSLALAVGLSMYDLFIREITLSQVAQQSQNAIFAADSGAECALYWDAKAPTLNGSPSVFGTSSASSWGASPVNCNGQNVTVQGPPTIDLSQYTSPGHPEYNCVSSSAWCISTNATAATTTFRIDFNSAAYCATVIVAKSGNPSQTTVTSHGYNNCGTGANFNTTVRLERALQVSY